MKTAELLLAHFRGRTDTIAVANGKGFHPQPVPEIRPAWLVNDHLSGKRCFGFYPMTQAHQVYCTAVDFDSHADTPNPRWREDTEQLYYWLTELGLCPLVEISQSGEGAHLWLFLEDATDAWLVRKFWAAVEAKMETKFVEVYPRQDKLTGKKLGNLLRYPLWGHSSFVDVEADWKAIAPTKALKGVRKADSDSLRTLIFQLSGESPRQKEGGVTGRGLSARVDRLVSRSHTLLNKRWEGEMSGLRDQSRSALVLSIATELVRLYVPTVEVEQALKVWCKRFDYKKGERADWIHSTVQKAYDFISNRHEEKHSTSLTMEDAVASYVDLVERGEPPCLPSGIRSLDYSIDGVAPGEVCVIAARPGHGKTAFAMQWVDKLARSNKRCLLISEEMTSMELGKRALASISRLDREKWQHNIGELRVDINDYYQHRAPIHLVESCQTIDEVERQIDEHCNLHGVEMVAVDYVQLLKTTNRKSSYESVTDISRRLKQAATRNNIALLALAQLNREIEKRDDKDPKLSDLRDSGSLEQDADLILFLQWPHKMDVTLGHQRYLVWCSKRRNGPIRTPMVELNFNPPRQSFGD